MSIDAVLEGLNAVGEPVAEQIGFAGTPGDAQQIGGELAQRIGQALSGFAAADFCLGLTADNAHWNIRCTVGTRALAAQSRMGNTVWVTMMDGLEAPCKCLYPASCRAGDRAALRHRAGHGAARAGARQPCPARRQGGAQAVFLSRLAFGVEHDRGRAVRRLVRLSRAAFWLITRTVGPQVSVAQMMVFPFFF
jgi:hypothetical protein